MKLRIATARWHTSIVYLRVLRTFHFDGTVLAFHVSAAARPFHDYDWIGVLVHKILYDNQRRPRSRGTMLKHFVAICALLLAVSLPAFATNVTYVVPADKIGPVLN